MIGQLDEKDLTITWQEPPKRVNSWRPLLLQFLWYLFLLLLVLLFLDSPERGFRYWGL